MKINLPTWIGFSKPCIRVFSSPTTLDFPFFRTFGSRIMLFLVSIALSALNYAFGLHLQRQNCPNAKNRARNITLSQIAITQFLPKPMEYYTLEVARIPKHNEHH